MFMLAVVSDVNVSKLAYRIQRFNWTETSTSRHVLIYKCVRSTEEPPAEEDLYEAQQPAGMEEDLYENVCQDTFTVSPRSVFSIRSPPWLQLL